MWNGGSWNLFQLHARNVLKKYGIHIEFCSGTTHDTAANSFNSFDLVPIILQLPCVAHKFSLCLSHGFDGCYDRDSSVGNEKT